MGHWRDWPLGYGGAAVSNMGWNEYGSPLQLKFLGSQTMCRQPLPAPAVIVPVSPVVWSAISTKKPWGVSCIETRTWALGIISRTSGVGVNGRVFALLGPVGPMGLPLVVTNANGCGSTHLLLRTLKSKLPWRLVIVRATHQWTWSHEMCGA